MLWKIAFGIFVVLMIGQAVRHASDSAAIEKAAARAQVERDAAKERDKAAAATDEARQVADFTARRAEILTDLKAKAASKKWTEAHDAAIKFKDVADPEYIEIAAAIHKAWTAEQTRIREAKIAAAEKADRAERKKRGVTIGMTKDEVLKSSWGRPEKVNITRRASGDSEQWVYPGSQYLYFENGRLTTAQTSR